MKKLSLVIAGLLASSQLHALGIGEAQLHSHIGEPLDITVPLYLDADELAAIQQLRASIGDRAMFERMHLEYRDTLRQMNVVVEQQGRNTLLRIQSDTRFSEPMAEFPLDVSLAGSRLVRTVTLLLDPPPLQVAAPSSRPAPVSRRETTRPAPTSSVAPRRTTVATGSQVITTKRDGEHYGPVAVNQTLGEIAQAVRPSDANLNQTLVALWELNPDAFIGNNMNRLMAGSTLRIPDRERILAISPAEAQRQVVAQYQQMKAPTRTAARPVVAEPAPAPPVQQQAATPEKDAVTAPQAATSTAEAPASEEARLSLLAPSNIEQIPEIFQEEVKLLGEQLRGLNEENTELRDRIGELSGISAHCLNRW
jgi:pilus assembly protein FimV